MRSATGLYSHSAIDSVAVFAPASRKGTAASQREDLHVIDLTWRRHARGMELLTWQTQHEERCLGTSDAMLSRMLRTTVSDLKGLFKSLFLHCF